MDSFKYSVGQTLKYNKNGNLGVVVFCGKEEVHLRTATGFIVDPRIDDENLEVVSEDCQVDLPVVHTEKSDNKTERKVRTGTKSERARVLFVENSKLSRKEMINLFKSELEMTDAGAATYYANIKKLVMSTQFKERMSTTTGQLIDEVDEVTEK